MTPLANHEPVESGDVEFDDVPSHAVPDGHLPVFAHGWPDTGMHEDATETIRSKVMSHVFSNGVGIDASQQIRRSGAHPRRMSRTSPGRPA